MEASACAGPGVLITGVDTCVSVALCGGQGGHGLIGTASARHRLTASVPECPGHCSAALGRERRHLSRASLASYRP